MELTFHRGAFVSAELLVNYSWCYLRGLRVFVVDDKSHIFVTKD